MRQIPLVLLLLFCNNVFALETEQAYRLIPHQRTVFDMERSNIPESDAQSVARLLLLAEKAMVERVDALRNGPAKSNYLSRIDSILWQIEQLPVPSTVDAASAHILAAVQQHRAFFELYGASGNQAKQSREQLVQSSHRHLISAYNQLMQSYPAETKHNKQAFFDYLCALDFI
jgi:hypothetical protein